MRGEAVPEPKKPLVLPIVVGAIGVQNLSHATLNAVDVGVVASGCAVSLALGLLRGRLDKVSMVNGAPYMAWSAASVAVLVVNVVSKIALDAGGVAAGGSAKALGTSVLFSLGLTLFGEAVVVWQRTQSLLAERPSEDRYRGSVQAPGRPTIWPPIR
jgi:hypothetical protein